MNAPSILESTIRIEDYMGMDTIQEYCGIADSLYRSTCVCFSSSIDKESDCDSIEATRWPHPFERMPNAFFNTETIEQQIFLNAYFISCPQLP